MKSASLVTAFITLGSIAGCATEEGAPLEPTVAATGNLVVSAEEGVATGSEISAAEARRLFAAAAAVPVAPEPDPGQLLAEIPRLTGRARIAAINDYVSYAQELPGTERPAAIARLAGLWRRGPEPDEDPVPPPPPPPPPPPAIVASTIGFGQSSGLANLPFEQAYGFAAPPWYTHDWATLGWHFKVDESGGLTAGHYHIWSDDPHVNCITTSAAWPNGVMGKDHGTSTCSPINPLNESRSVITHGAGYWVRIRNVTSTTSAWRASKIKVLGTREVRVMVDNTDGTWWEYTHLTPGSTWTLLPNGHKAETAWVMNQNPSAASPMEFDNFTIVGPL